LLLDLAPEFVRAQRQRHIFWAFANGLARDARVAMRGPQRVRRGILIQAQHLLAFAGQLIDGGAAHRAQAKDNGVIFGAHSIPHLPIVYTRALYSLASLQPAINSASVSSGRSSE